MRVNVYSEELTGEVELIGKYIPGTGSKYYGLRIFLKSPQELHHTVQDDDRSAVTFWYGTKHGALQHMEHVMAILRNKLYNEAPEERDT